MTIKSRVLAGVAAAIVLLFGLPTMAVAQAPAVEPESTTTISLAEFRKLLAEPLASNPGCGTRCDYQSPYFWVYYCGVGCPDNYRCSDDAVTIAEPGSGPHLEYRYSPGCRTGWARGQGCYDSGGSLVVGLGNFSYYNTNWNSGRRAETWGPANPGTCYSRQLSVANMWGVVAYQYGPGTTYSDWVYGY